MGKGLDRMDGDIWRLFAPGHVSDDNPISFEAGMPFIEFFAF